MHGDRVGARASYSGSTDTALRLRLDSDRQDHPKILYLPSLLAPSGMHLKGPLTVRNLSSSAGQLSRNPHGDPMEPVIKQSPRRTGAGTYLTDDEPRGGVRSFWFGESFAPLLSSSAGLFLGSIRHVAEPSSSGLGVGRKGEFQVARQPGGVFAIVFPCVQTVPYYLFLDLCSCADIGICDFPAAGLDENFVEGRLVAQKVEEGVFRLPELGHIDRQMIADLLGDTGTGAQGFGHDEGQDAEEFVI